MPELEISLLGRFQVLVDGTPISEQRWSRKKAKVLLKLLALAPRHKIHREQLMNVLWPDMETDAALNNLHKVIHAARRALEPEFTQGTSRFLFTQDSLVFLSEGNVCIDIDKFERYADEALKTGEVVALEAALALYRGDLLEEDLYEDWASVPRERLRLQYQRTLERLAGRFEASKDERAIDVLNRLLAINRANEDAHRRLMHLYAVMGHRHLALQQYRMCSEALKEELDTTPEPLTVQLYECLLTGTGAAEREMRPTRQAISEPPVSAPANAVPPAALKPSYANSRHFRIAAIALLVLLSLAAFLLATSRSRAAHPVPSLAVLPLRTRGSSPTIESTADGMTENLINNLSRLPGIRIMARGTVFVYKGRVDAREVGRELRVTTVANGYLKQEDQTSTVGVELIDVGDGSRVWARQYSGPTDTLASLEQLLTSELKSTIQSKVTGQPVEKMSSPAPAPDPEAHRLYLTGRSFWNQRTRPGFLKSIEYYQGAIDRDPEYALAYAGLADSYGLLGWANGLPRDWFPRARTAAEKALQLDQTLAEAQTTLAMVNALYDWNWAAAEAQFRRAIELNVGYVTAHHWYGVHLGAMGRFDEARRELSTAVTLDPLSPIVNLNFGYPALYQRHFREAMDVFNRVLNLNGSFAPAHENRMFVYAHEGDTASAAREAIAFLQYSGQTELAGILEAASAKGGYRGALRSWLEFSEKTAEREFVSPMIPARLAAALEDRDRSFLWLNRALEQRSPQLVYLAVDPQYDYLRPDPRFKSLVQQIGLPLH